MIQKSVQAIFSRFDELTQEAINNGNALNFEIDVQFLQIYDNRACRLDFGHIRERVTRIRSGVQVLI